MEYMTDFVVRFCNNQNGLKIILNFILYDVFYVLAGFWIELETMEIAYRRGKIRSATMEKLVFPHSPNVFQIILLWPRGAIRKPIESAIELHSDSLFLATIFQPKRQHNH